VTWTVTSNYVRVDTSRRHTKAEGVQKERRPEGIYKEREKKTKRAFGEVRLGRRHVHKDNHAKRVRLYKMYYHDPCGISSQSQADFDRLPASVMH
jgi:hypothetical protein